MKPEDYGYVLKNNLCLFLSGPLSQWWGGFRNQNSEFFVEEEDFFNLITSYTDAIKLETYLEDAGGMKFNCCEQWMMACKAALFDDTDTLDKIFNTTDPYTQKNLGRQVNNYDQEIWNAAKQEIVLVGNVYKFEQNLELENFLKQFNEHTLFAEGNEKDSVWGIGLDVHDPLALDINNWKGENLLGDTIRTVRRNFLH